VRVAAQKRDPILFSERPALWVFSELALVQLVEADGLAAGGSVELDRERDQAESDLAFPNGSRHKGCDLAMTFALVVGISKARNGETRRKMAPRSWRENRLSLGG
jgi:hypothetical protein